MLYISTPSLHLIHFYIASTNRQYSVRIYSPNGDLRNIDILGTVTDGVAYLFGPLLQKRPVNYRSIILLKNLTFIGLSSTRTGLIWSIAAFSRYLRTSLYNNWVCGSEK